MAAEAQAVDAPYLLHRVRVARRERVSSGFVRVTFTGPTLDGFADPGLDQRIKLILPAPDGTLDAMPFTPTWYADWRALPDERRPVIRTYTTRAVRPAEREVDIDVVLHEPSGPAGRFAADCREGDEVILSGPNRRSSGDPGGLDFRLPASARRVLVAADETGLPAVVRILEGLPDGVSGRVLVEVPRSDDGTQVPARAGVETRVLVRGDEPHGALLAAAVREAAERLFDRGSGAVPEDVDVEGGLLWEVPGDGAIAAEDASNYAWLAGEAAVIKALRRTLVAELGVDRGSIAFMGYWRRGRAELD